MARRILLAIVVSIVIFLPNSTPCRGQENGEAGKAGACPADLPPPRELIPPPPHGLLLPLTPDGRFDWNAWSASSVFHFGLPEPVSLTGFGAPRAIALNVPRVFDERFGWPQANNATIYEYMPGVSLPVVTYFGMPTIPGLVVKARADVVVESVAATDIPGNSVNAGPAFSVKSIPVTGEAFRLSGWQSSVLVSGTTIAQNNLTKTPLGLLRTYYENDFIQEERPNGTQTNHYDLRYLYAQLENFGAGQSPSAFSDISVRPDTVDRIGPNARMYVQQPRVFYLVPFEQTDQRALTFETSIESPRPEIAVTSILGSTRSISRIPDCLAVIDWRRAGLGELRIAGVMRGIGLANAANTFHETVFGWGTKCSAYFTPFAGIDAIKGDIIYFAINYGEGIAHYNSDLTGSSFDAGINPSGHLQALPLLCYFAAYYHFWSPKWRSTVVYSEVDLDTLPSQGQLAYKQGRYVAANLGYRIRPNVDISLGYNYGRKLTFNDAHGDANRIQLALVFFGDSN